MFDNEDDDFVDIDLDFQDENGNIETVTYSVPHELKDYIEDIHDQLREAIIEQQKILEDYAHALRLLQDRDARLDLLRPTN